MYLSFAKVKQNLENSVLQPLTHLLDFKPYSFCNLPRLAFPISFYNTL